MSRTQSRDRRRRRSLLAAAACALLWPGAAPAAAEAESADGGEPAIWYAQRLTQSDRGHIVTHFWSRERLLRVETVVAGIPVLTLVDETHYYAIDELHGEGVAIERSAAARALDETGGRPFANETASILADGGEKVRTERLGGREVDVLRITDGAGRREAWVTQDELRLPIVVEVFDRASGETTTTRYLGWSRLTGIPDAFFEPDPRVALERMAYDEYVERSAKGPVGPVPVLYGEMLHGDRG